MPVVWMNSAMTPANGPRPTATTNSTAQTISWMARKKSISRRQGCRMYQGTMLCADRMPKGMASNTDRTVPQRAICTVTTISSA